MFIRDWHSLTILLFSLLLIFTPLVRADEPHDWNGDGDVDLLDFAVFQRHNGHDPNDPNDPILAVHDFDVEEQSNGTIGAEDYLAYCASVYGVGVDSNNPVEPGIPPCDPPEELEDDDLDDDENWPKSSPFPEDAGDGLFLRLTTGNVWTRVPVFRAYTSGKVDMQFLLRYDSIRAPLGGPVGYGWTHNYNIFVQVVEEDDNGPSKIIYWEGNGRRNAFKRYGDYWEPPKGRAYTLTYESDHFELLKTNGTRLVFEPIVGSRGPISQIVDRRGRTRHFYYNADGALWKVISPRGRVITLDYQNGRVWKIHHPDGEFTELTYAGVNLVRITDPEDHYLEYQYDDTYGHRHRVTRERLKNGKIYTAEYTGNTQRKIKDGVGNTIARVITSCYAPFPTIRSELIKPATVYYRDGRYKTWRVYRDNLGRLREVRARTGHRWACDYGDRYSGSNRNRVICVTNEKDLTEAFEWGYNGRITNRTDEAGHVTDYEYSEPTFPALLTKRIEPGTDPDRDEWVYQYDPSNGDLLTIIDPRDESEYDPNVADAVVTYAYTYYGPREDLPDPTFPDLPGRIKQVTRTDRNGNVVFLEYDGSGNMNRVTRAHGDLNLVIEYDYDDMGRRTHKYVYRGTADVVVTEWQYDSMGHLTHVIRDPNVEAITTVYDYDNQGYLETITNPRGHVSRYEYDHRNRLERKTVAEGVLNLVTEWGLDGNGNVTWVTDPEENVTQLHYDDRNFLYWVEDPEGYDTWLDRDAVGNVTKLYRALDTAGTDFYEVEYEYDEIDRLTAKIADPGEELDDLNLTTTIEYTDPSGCSGCSGATPGSARPYKIVDPEGKVVYFHYDELDRRTMSVRKVGDTDDEAPDADDAATQYEYDPRGNLTAIVGPEGTRIEFEYDEANRRTILRGKDSVHGDVEITIDYDGANNVVNAILPNGNTIVLGYDALNRLETATDDLGLIAELTYDDNGNVLTRTTGVANQTWEYHYDEANRLDWIKDPVVEYPDDAYTQFGYDKNSNRVSVTDNNGVETHYEYDTLNRLVKMIRDYQETPDPESDTANTDTTIGYNGVRQTSLKDHDNNETEYKYDAALRLIEAIYPDDDGNGSGTVTYDYDDSGNLVYRKDQNGVETNYQYNDLYQLEQRSYTGGRSETFNFDRAGRLLQALNDAATIDFQYDDLGRLDAVTQTYAADNDSYTTDFDYVVAMNDVHATINYPGSRTVTKTYDSRFRLDGVLDGSGNGVSEWLYDLAGRRTNATLGNDVTSVFTYDLNNRITRIQHADEWSNDLFDVQHGYDPVGNRLWTKDYVRAGRDELFEYDALNRLRGFQRGTLNTEKTAIETPLDHAFLPNEQVFNLDRNGNWDQTVESVGVPQMTVDEHRSVNAVNEYLTVTFGANPAYNLTSDDNGNLTSDPSARNAGDGVDRTGQMYEYDEENRLTAVRRGTNGEFLLEITYDALGRRIESVDYADVSDPCGDSSTPVVTRHIYAGLETLEEHVLCDDGQGGDEWRPAREFLWGNRFPEPVAMIDHTDMGNIPATGSPGGGEEVLHYLHNALGGVVALTDSDGVVVERYEYDPYGKTYIEDPSTGDRRDASAFGNPFAWTAQRYDAGVRLYHFPFRSYSTRLGRWLQRDPLGYVNGVSMYEYAASMPTFFTDPLGLMAAADTSPPGSADDAGGVGTIGDDDDPDDDEDIGDDGPVGMPAPPVLPDDERQKKIEQFRKWLKEIRAAHARNRKKADWDLTDEEIANLTQNMWRYLMALLKIDSNAFRNAMREIEKYVTDFEKAHPEIKKAKHYDKAKALFTALQTLQSMLDNDDIDPLVALEMYSNVLDDIFNFAAVGIKIPGIDTIMELAGAVKEAVDKLVGDQTVQNNVRALMQGQPGGASKYGPFSTNWLKPPPPESGSKESP